MAQKILILEKDSGVEDVLQQALEMSGYEVNATCDTDLVTSIYKLQPDLLILDLWQLDDEQIHDLKNLRRKKGLPILGTTTGNVGEEKADEVIDDKMGKPFDIQILEQKVKVLLDQ